MKKLFPLIVILLAFAACQVPSTQPGTTTGLMLVFSGEVDRSLLPSLDMSVATYTIIGTNSGDSTTFTRTVPSATGTLMVNALSVGTWSLVLQAANAAGTIIGGASTAATLLPNQINNVTLTVSPLSGNGTLNMTFSWPAQVTNPTLVAKLTPIAPTTGSVVTLPTTIIGQSATSVVAAIGAGYYTLTASLLQNGAAVAGGADVVRIVAGQTTLGTYAFSVGGVSGILSLKLVSNMKAALIPQLTGSAAPFVVEGTPATVFSAALASQPQGPNGPLSVDYSWYVNGVFATKTTPAIGAPSTYSFGGNGVVPGLYRVDVLANATDGSSGSANTGLEKVFGAQWAKTSASGSAVFNDAVSDGLGYVYAVGSFTAGVDFGNGFVIPTGIAPGAVIVKYNDAGTPVAMKYIPVTSGGAFYDATFDLDGNLLVAGWGGPGSYNFGTITISGAQNSYNLLVAKLSSDLTTQWAKTTTSGNGTSVLKRVSADSMGNVYVAGYITTDTGIGLGNAVTASGVGASNSVPLIVKYSASGLAQWARSAISTTSASSGYNDVAVSPNGDAFAVGYTSGGPLTILAGTTIPATAYAVGFVTKYSASGVLQWASAPAANLVNFSLQGIAADSVGSVVVVGNLSLSTSSPTGQVAFGSGVAVSAQSTFGRPLIAKFSGSGVPLWARVATSSGAASGGLSSVAIDDADQPVATGAFANGGLWDFGNGVSTQVVTTTNAMIVAFTSTGQPRWVQTPVSGPGTFSVGSISIENTNHIYVSGKFGVGGVIGLGGANSVSITGAVNGPLLVRY